MAAELKPCPFCGNKHPWMQTETDSDGFGFFLYVKCGICNAQSGKQYVSRGNDCPQTRQEVRDTWNQRTTFGVALPAATDWTDDAACLSELADRLDEESATESDMGNDSAAMAWACRAHELRQIVSKMVRNAGVIVPAAPQQEKRNA